MTPTHAEPPGAWLPGSGAWPALAIAAPCLLTLCLAAPAAHPRGRLAEAAAACTSLTCCDAVANDLTASPCVTSPSAPVARFGISDLPSVASVVQVRWLAQVLISRMGGLHGP